MAHSFNATRYEYSFSRALGVTYAPITSLMARRVDMLSSSSAYVQVTKTDPSSTSSRLFHFDTARNEELEQFLLIGYYLQLGPLIRFRQIAVRRVQTEYCQPSLCLKKCIFGSDRPTLKFTLLEELRIWSVLYLLQFKECYSHSVSPRLVIFFQGLF
jgi:hypothetical protein